MQVESLPTWLADFWGINLEPAQTILSVILMLSVLLPVLLLSRGKIPPLVLTVLVFLMEAFLVGIGWFPFWLLITTLFLVALAGAGSIRNAIMGE